MEPTREVKIGGALLVAQERDVSMTQGEVIVCAVPWFGVVLLLLLMRCAR